MKNTIKILMCAILAFAFMGCTKSGEENNGRLATPKFTINVEGNTLIVAWEEISGAAYYEVGINPGSIHKTDKVIHKFEDLEFNTEYEVSLKAVATEESKSSKTATKRASTAEFQALAYREWYPQINVPATAISNNARWVVGGNERNGFILDLNKNKMVEIVGTEFYDVADDGTAVGSNHVNNQDGDAIYYNNGQTFTIDLSGIAIKPGMSCATGITPDGEYVVGWYWEYDENGYYAKQYGMVVPFCYDISKDRVTVPLVGERVYNEAAATAIKAVAPDRTLLGYEQSEGIHSIIWADEYTPFEYVYFKYDEQYNPVYSLGDNQNLFSQSGRYVYGRAVDYAAGQNTYAAAYDRETSTLYTLPGVSVTAMSDNGIAFINDTPYYLGTTSYVVDTTKGEPYDWVEFEDWVFDEHDIDIASFEPTTDFIENDGVLMEGIIIVGVSEDCRTIVGITNTDMGWMTFVVDLDGKKAE